MQKSSMNATKMGSAECYEREIDGEGERAREGTGSNNITGIGKNRWE